MEREARTPLYATYEESIDGRITLRAYDAGGHFARLHNAKMEQYLACKYLQLVSAFLTPHFTD